MFVCSWLPSPTQHTCPDRLEASFRGSIAIPTPHVRASAHACSCFPGLSPRCSPTRPLRTKQRGCHEVSVRPHETRESLGLRLNDILWVYFFPYAPCTGAAFFVFLAADKTDECIPRFWRGARALSACECAHACVCVTPTELGYYALTVFRSEAFVDRACGVAFCNPATA